jgi:hypothetical protein
MICEMSLPRTWVLVLLVALLFGLGCGASTSANEPQTAKEKQLREAKANGDADSGKKWGGWRYQGDRNECFYVVGRRCFKNENAACQAARCKAPKKCDVVGGGPATVGCK